MKALYPLLILLLLVSTTRSQNTAQLPEAPNLLVVEKEWHVQFRNPELDEDPFRPNNELRQAQIDRRENDRRNALRARRGQPLEVPPVRTQTVEARRPDPWTSYIYELKIKNTGEKEIKAIVWDYVFLEPGTQRELGRQRFLSKTDLAPNKTKNLVMRSVAPPTGSIKVNETGKKLLDQYAEKVVILGIEYKDGTIWGATSLN